MMDKHKDFEIRLENCHLLKLSKEVMQMAESDSDLLNAVYRGYLYRYWHYHTGESSAKIFKQAPVATMKRNYMMFHTMDPVLAIENLKEIHNQKT